MPPQPPDTPGPLVAAARALEDELTRYARLTDQLRSITINSEKTLARASRAMQEAAGCHEQILANVAALSAAMVETRERQERGLQQMAEAASSVSERATAFRTLLARYQGLAERSRSLNGLAAKAAALKSAGADAGDVSSAIADLLEGTGDLVAQAAELSAAARADDFDDLARSVDALRQEMQSARNKLSLAHKTRADPGPS